MSNSIFLLNKTYHSFSFLSEVLNNLHTDIVVQSKSYCPLFGQMKKTLEFFYDEKILTINHLNSFL